MRPTAPDTPAKGETAAARQHEAASLSGYFDRVHLAAARLAFSLETGRHGRRRAGPGETFWQHRPYSFGDAVSAIDWRQSARAQGHLYVRQNEWEAANAVWLWRDPSASMRYASASTFETKRFWADVFAVASAMVLADNGERVGVIGGQSASATGTSRLFRGRGAGDRVLESLDHGAVEQTHTIPADAHIRPDQRIVFISDFFMETEVLANALTHYAARGARGLLLRILDPAETGFPFRGRTEFADLESPERLIFGRADAVRGDYLAAFQAHSEAVEAIAKAAGWPMLSHVTDNAGPGTLRAIFDLMEAGAC